MSEKTRPRDLLKPHVLNVLKDNTSMLSGMTFSAIADALRARGQTFSTGTLDKALQSLKKDNKIAFVAQNVGWRLVPIAVDAGPARSAN